MAQDFTADDLKKAEPDLAFVKMGAGANSPDSGRASSALRPGRLFGLTLVSVSLVTTLVAFAILMGFTGIEPNEYVTQIIAATIAGLIFCLVVTVGFEIFRLWRARLKGRAAARLHIRLVSLFAFIAAVPALIVAVVASLTLDQGLDRWFSDRTQSIVQSSVIVARSYLNEHARFLLADIDAIARDYERIGNVVQTNPSQRKLFLTTQAQIRKIPHLQIIDGNGEVIDSAHLPSPREWPEVPEVALIDAKKSIDRVPIFINPGRTKNLVGAIIRIDQFEEKFLYAVKAVDPKVVQYLRDAELKSAEYSSLQASRTGTQIAFALLYLGVALVLLVSSVWLAINFADNLVNPIRQLMLAAEQVSKGDLSVQVPVRKREGDIAALSETFNVMTNQLNDQRRDILDVNDKLDQRRRFIETVLAGVTAGVVGVSADGRIEVINRFGLSLIAGTEKDILDKPVSEVIPEVAPLIDMALASGRDDHRSQILLARRGMELTVNARITAEFSDGKRDGFVLTLDDITELVTAQRTSAWADVARRIAHEIKNPLTPIQLSAERLRRRFGKDLSEKDQEVFDKCTTTIVRQVGDIGRMVDEFSSFARMPKPTFAKGDMRECLKEAVYVREVAQPELRFAIDLPAEPMIGYFDERLMSQAITNLVKNAGEAIQKPEDDDGAFQGRIILRATADRDQMVVEIIDNGRGWPKENRNQLLEPYMTTRKKGTGLGLAIVVKVVEDHNGRVELLDAPDFAETGRGAMVRLTLPTHSDMAENAEAAA
ncbi:MAG: PAS domain-containing sensor histidine kinase [Rhizobiales bacterium]|nr:PAS domain-containing sensor histidine kinase [Hyphomicrobiales bacterium]